MSRDVIRFGVKDSSGGRSSVWTIITKKEKSDVYLFARAIGGSIKVSFHESGC